MIDGIDCSNKGHTDVVNCFVTPPMKNKHVLIHMIAPEICEVKIRNSYEYIILNKDGFRHHTIRKKIRIQGDIVICDQWNEKHCVDIFVVLMQNRRFLRFS